MPQFIRCVTAILVTTSVFTSAGQTFAVDLQVTRAILSQPSSLLEFEAEMKKGDTASVEIKTVSNTAPEKEWLESVVRSIDSNVHVNTLIEAVKIPNTTNDKQWKLTITLSTDKDLTAELSFVTESDWSIQYRAVESPKPPAATSYDLEAKVRIKDTLNVQWPAAKVEIRMPNGYYKLANTARMNAGGTVLVPAPELSTPISNVLLRNETYLKLADGDIFNVVSMANAGRNPVLKGSVRLNKRPGFVPWLEMQTDLMPGATFDLLSTEFDLVESVTLPKQGAVRKAYETRGFAGASLQCYEWNGDELRLENKSPMQQVIHFDKGVPLTIPAGNAETTFVGSSRNQDSNTASGWDELNIDLLDIEGDKLNTNLDNLKLLREFDSTSTEEAVKYVVGVYERILRSRNRIAGLLQMKGVIENSIRAAQSTAEPTKLENLQAALGSVVTKIRQELPLESALRIELIETVFMKYERALPPPPPSAPIPIGLERHPMLLRLAG